MNLKHVKLVSNDMGRKSDRLEKYTKDITYDGKSEQLYCFQYYVCLFDPLENFSLIWRRHPYR